MSYAYDAHGVTKVGAFLAPADAEGLKQIVAVIYDLLDRETQRGAPINAGLADNFKKWQGVWLKEVGAFLYAQSPALERNLTTAIASVEAAFARAFPDRRCQLCLDRTFFRRVAGAHTFVGWHTDADAANMTVYGGDSVNAWVPLQPVGGEASRAPTLEFVPGSHVKMRDAPTLPRDLATRNTWVDTTFPQQRWAPEAVVGDAVVFSQWTVHRTQRLKCTPVERTSCEFRFVPA